MLSYYKREWPESRGDEFDSWGTATWYFEVDENTYPQRQIEVYESGQTLKYHSGHLEDIYGRLGDQALPADEFEAFRITQAEFDSVWNGTSNLDE